MSLPTFSFISGSGARCTSVHCLQWGRGECPIQQSAFARNSFEEMLRRRANEVCCFLGVMHRVQWCSRAFDPLARHVAHVSAGNTAVWQMMRFLSMRWTAGEQEAFLQMQISLRLLRAAPRPCALRVGSGSCVPGPRQPANAGHAGTVSSRASRPVGRPPIRECLCSLLGSESVPQLASLFFAFILSQHRLSSHRPRGCLWCRPQRAKVPTCFDSVILPVASRLCALASTVEALGCPSASRSTCHWLGARAPYLISPCIRGLLRWRCGLRTR